MNPAAHLRHLYFQTKGFHHTKSGSWACSRPTKLTRIDETVEQLETEMSPSEIFGGAL
jgi:hypothetical protein